MNNTCCLAGGVEAFCNIEAFDSAQPDTCFEFQRINIYLNINPLGVISKKVNLTHRSIDFKCL